MIQTFVNANILRVLYVRMLIIPVLERQTVSQMFEEFRGAFVIKCVLERLEFR